MNRLEVARIGEELANATADWLAERSREGFSVSLLNEALLVIPIFYYFKQPSWKDCSLRGEWGDWGRPDIRPGDVNIDFVAEYGEDKLLLEFKYLKKSNDSRLIKDVVKLALATDPKFARLLLVAHSNDHHVDGQSKSELLKHLLSAKRAVTFKLDQIIVTKKDKEMRLATVTSDLDTPAKRHILSEKDGEAVAKIMNFEPRTTAFSVEHIYSCAKDKPLVTVLSVTRL
ncbi:hypothetical protein ACMA5K_33910 [Bradyrhizobium diazoefficiens]|uniref:hypothetical protein n=1 Tax=Bradyrhizobium diazoefficiens TaxID=1355477 RepID=UPI0015B60B15|nr:hypothetical protein [Bradyrhizobium diazoefficiens]QLD45616.1 hypothetical protein HUW42_33570 [Bradyrhizobium diazoefficiens]